MNTKILVIEDNENNMYLVTYLLEKAGYEVLPAETGLQGIEISIASSPAVILLDIHLPEMDGYDVARKFRSDPRFNKTPLIALTSFAMPGDRQKCIDAGCDDYMSKPIDPDTFISEIEGFLSRGRSG